jgi:hypothetical protein
MNLKYYIFLLVYLCVWGCAEPLPYYSVITERYANLDGSNKTFYVNIVKDENTLLNSRVGAKIASILKSLGYNEVNAVKDANLIVSFSYATDIFSATRPFMNIEDVSTKSFNQSYNNYTVALLVGDIQYVLLLKISIENQKNKTKVFESKSLIISDDYSLMNHIDCLTTSNFLTSKSKQNFHAIRHSTSKLNSVRFYDNLFSLEPVIKDDSFVYFCYYKKG